MAAVPLNAPSARTPKPQLYAQTALQPAANAPASPNARHARLASTSTQTKQQ